MTWLSCQHNPSQIVELGARSELRAWFARHFAPARELVKLEVADT
jgi:hypothetical protein